jgi:hypothetical protein
MENNERGKRWQHLHGAAAGPQDLLLLAEALVEQMDLHGKGVPEKI